MTKKFGVLTKEIQDKMDSLTPEQKQEIAGKIIQHYINEFNIDIYKWISIKDMIDFVMEEKDGIYVALHPETKDIFERIKKTKCQVITAEEFIEANKELNKGDKK